MKERGERRHGSLEDGERGEGVWLGGKAMGGKGKGVRRQMSEGRCGWVK